MAPNSYPRTIDNGAGELLTWVGLARDQRGEYMQIEGRVAPGSGPPMHIHHLQDEAITVVEGKAGYQVPGGEPKYAGPGETMTFTRGIAHRFWNAGQNELVVKGNVWPPHNIEYFLTAVYEALRSNGGQRPNPFDAAFLLHHFRSEFKMLAVPAPVQTFVFPVFRMIGHMTGKYKKYADAPAAVQP